jgi:hypothetical protein
MHETEYRLGEHVLMEHSHFLLTWLLQFPMGAQRIGKCYVVGNILVILPWYRHEPGYLRMEFHYHLRKLPVWHKTTFYVFASSLHQVIGGRALADDMIELLALNAINLDLSNNIELGTFRLGRYKIKADNDNALSWQTLGLNNKVLCGSCFLESGLLLLGPTIEESSAVVRKSFYSELNLLPQWDKTLAWGYAENLRRCKESKHNKITSVTAWNPEPAKSFEIGRMSFSLSQSWKGERSPKLDKPNNVRHKMEWKYLGEFALQTLVFFYTGLRMCILLLTKMINYVAKRWNLFKTDTETNSS